MRASAKGIDKIMRQLFCADEDGTKQAFSKNVILEVVRETFPNVQWKEDIYYPYCVRGARNWEVYKESGTKNINEDWTEDNYEIRFGQFLKYGIALYLDKDVKAYRLPLIQSLFNQLIGDRANFKLDGIAKDINKVRVKGAEIEFRKYNILLEDK